MTTAAVITLHQVDNYGTQLQAYATQEKLKQYEKEQAKIQQLETRMAKAWSTPSLKAIR